ncbi:Bgt-1761 [Blumeria graminis f. sp. tritici]|uniref:Bgt-1761 n=2 Tax=Blumeria graminis f. sp. tritici TaxID=62690 RepID=A0A061HNK7_BLUGR|nr:hypothetical protein BGT96224_1761 [Blumeria graminis f. sp. tritici 96224]VDB90816.1 Bgt-1761 [Blumeria graminis f. sp. tritici]
MGHGEAQVKIHYKGEIDDFIIFIESTEAANDWKKNKETSLANVVASYDVFVTGKHGAQGSLGKPSMAVLENEFGTSIKEEIIKKIIEKGTIQESDGIRKYSSKNDSIGPRAGH